MKTPRLATGCIGNVANRPSDAHYVANAGNGTVSEVTPAGLVSTFVSGLSLPVGLAFDAAGNLYVANIGNNTVSTVV